MILTIIFIITSIFQFYSYKINYKKENKVNDFFITFLFILIYILVHPPVSFIIYESTNHYNLPFIFQIIIVGGIGFFFTLITNVFWYLEKRKLG